jgi:two-component system OmpR family response regulator
VTLAEPSARKLRPRVLVVDDEDSILFATCEYFEALGFEAHGARELEEAEALLSHVSYAVVIADLRLTGIYGTEGLAMVAFVKERCPHTSIVLLTAYRTPQLEAEARRLGVDSFVQKPKPLADLAQIVFALLDRRAE